MCVIVKNEGLSRPPAIVLRVEYEAVLLEITGEARMQDDSSLKDINEITLRMVRRRSRGRPRARISGTHMRR